jgi:hypothetical protein
MNDATNSPTPGTDIVPRSNSFQTEFHDSRLSTERQAFTGRVLKARFAGLVMMQHLGMPLWGATGRSSAEIETAFPADIGSS